MDTTLTIRIDLELEQLIEESSKRSGKSKKALKRLLTFESFQQLKGTLALRRSTRVVNG